MVIIINSVDRGRATKENKENNDINDFPIKSRRSVKITSQRLNQN